MQRVGPSRFAPDQSVRQPADAQVNGFWWWTWGPTRTALPDTNLCIAISGWADPDIALKCCARIRSDLPGSKYISLGGDDSSGAFTQRNLTSITHAINAGAFAGYDGIAFDVEQGEAGLEPYFEQAFAAAKAGNHKVLVTVSQSAPYGISDGDALMQSFFADANIDYLSPQLYASGREKSNDYQSSNAVRWAEYATAMAAVVPSIVDANLYRDAQNYFQLHGVTLSGFIQWRQT